MKNKRVKNSNNKDTFYLPIINSLKTSTNLTKLRKSLNISKQDLNYYLRVLKEKGVIEQKGRGWYEVKDSTKYDSKKDKDKIRAHAYIWEIKLPKEIEGWEKRIEILEKKGINFKLVGALKNTPRIKVLGRKVWLCNKKLRIFDKKDMSYYGDNAKESRNMSLSEIKLIAGVLERKLGIFIKPESISFQREHYALIKNDLAIEENRQGNIIRISDENGEWLLIDDSLGKGGELENVGKSSYNTNIPMQKWWNDNKRTNFEVTPTFLIEAIKGVTENQIYMDKNIVKHFEVLNNLNKAINELREEIKNKNGRKESN